jgi:hypothetical protein
MFLITPTDHDPHDKLQRPTASPVMTTTSAPIQVPVPAPTPTAAPNDITLFPTVDTNQPTLIIDESPLDTLEASTIFAATPRANIVQASSSEALRSSGILTSDAPSATPSATPSDVPSFVPSDVPSDVPSSVPSTGPSIDMTVFETVPIIPRVSGSATEQGSVDTVGATSGPSPSPVEFQRVPRIPYPTSGPSPSPTEQEVAIAKSVPQGSTLWLTADPVNLQAVGSVDVNLVRQPFFQHVETLMKPYMMKHVGEILRNFELNIEFLPPKTRSIPVGVTGSQFRTVSFFDVLVKMEISSENVDDLTLFRDEQATAAVTSFFKGMSLGALITSLNQASIRIDTILHAELSMEEHLANLYPVDEGLQVSDPFEKVQGNDPVESAIKPETSKDDKKDKAAALYAALVSGGAVLVAVMLAILYNRRRQRRFKIHYPGDSEEGSLFTDSDVSTIKPAAITLRDKSGDDNSVLSNMSPLYHQSVTRKPGFPIIPPRMSFDPDLGGEEKEELEHASEFVNTGSSALTCLDGAQQVDNLSKNYPEFDMYSSMPPSPSPAWSADGVTIPYSYSVDDEEYQKERKRWHDEADDLALIHIPDQRSVVSNFTMDDANDDEESYQENEI